MKTALTKAKMIIDLLSFKRLHLYIIIVVAAFVCLTGFVVLKQDSFIVVDGEEAIEVHSSSNEVEKIVAQAGLSLGEMDYANLVKSNDNSNIIEVTRKCRLTVVDVQTKEFVVDKSTVKQALEQAGIKVEKDDIVKPSLDSLIEDETKVIIDRVYYDTETTKVTLSYSNYRSIAKDNNQLNENLIGKDQQALVESTYKIKYINGQKAESELIKQTAKPVAQIIEVKKETKENSNKSTSNASSYSSNKTISVLKPKTDIKLDENFVPANYSKVIKGPATAYCANQGALTSTGKTPKPGLIAVDPKKIPYGTKMFIKSSDGKYIYGYAEAADTGGFVRGNKIIADLYFNSYNECINFGVRSIEIYILD